MRRSLTITLLFVFWVLPATAQPAPPSDPVKVALGGEIFDLFIAKQDYQARMRAIAQAVLKDEPPNSQASTSAALANVGKVIEDLRPTMRRAYAEAYARLFSLDELETIKAFNESPAGQKLLTEQPKISSEIIPEILPEMMSRMRADMPSPTQPSAEPTK